ncbi:TlpA family protein disulfide reductase [Kribbella monticola]|uniref:TlpA family protein disulfide reductase n=1 Tax=Kribbella monticola TaxID=2185285 RepID=UPI001E4D7913|nr:TlpA disulfide reductase family protein [Kribbella monticola]
MNHPRPPVRRYAVLAALALLAVLAGCGDQPAAGPGAAGTGSAKAVAGADKLVPCPTAESRPPVANGLPDISLPCLGNGPDVRLADLRGPLVINVWAQWCPPCRQESPYLAELQKKAGAKVKLIGIDYDDPRADEAVKFAIAQKLDYPHLVDSDKQTRVPFKIGGPPLTAFVDAKGALLHIHYGAFKSQQELDQLVEEKLGVSW